MVFLSLLRYFPSFLLCCVFIVWVVFLTVSDGTADGGRSGATADGPDIDWTDDQPPRTQKHTWSVISCLSRPSHQNRSIHLSSVFSSELVLDVPELNSVTTLLCFGPSGLAQLHRLIDRISLG